MKLEVLNELPAVKRGELIPSFSLGSALSLSLSRARSPLSLGLFLDWEPGTKRRSKKEGGEAGEKGGKKKRREENERIIVRKFESPALISAPFFLSFLDLILVQHQYNNGTTIHYMRMGSRYWSPSSCKGLLYNCYIGVVNLTFFFFLGQKTTSLG